MKWFLIVIGIVQIHTSVAQSADSLWCDKLNELLMCGSLDIISDRVGVANDTSVEIAKFKPKFFLTNTKEEFAGKKYDKFYYEGIFFIGNKNDETLKKQYQSAFEKYSHCLDLWSVDRFDNAIPELSFFRDYMFTNSEDETTVRLDVVKDKVYKIRVRIY